mmetsp:Transcript_50335/g.113107  ORF Transcript_50335/g.113107 Transcript_50335/m.113107 type:complete len:265 (-) Transcript_50335:242-1036(-)
MHLEVCLLAVLHVLEGDEGVLQRIPGLPVTDDLTALDWPKAREDELEVTILRHRVQLGYEEVVVGRRDVGVRQVVQQLQRRRLTLGQGLCHALLQLALVLLVLDLLELLVLDDLWGLRRNQLLQTVWIWKWIFKDLGVPDPDVLEGCALLIHHRLVDLVQHVEALGDNAEYRVLAIQVLHAVAECEVELRAVLVGLLVCHSDGALDIVLEVHRDLVLNETMRQARKLGKDCGPTLPRVRWVTGLADVVLLHRVYEAVVVVLDLA